MTMQPAAVMRCAITMSLVGRSCASGVEPLVVRKPTVRHVLDHLRNALQSALAVSLRLHRIAGIGLGQQVVRRQVDDGVERGLSVMQHRSACISLRQASWRACSLLGETILHARHPVEHSPTLSPIRSGRVIHPVRHKVPVPLELKFLVALR